MIKNFKNIKIILLSLIFLFILPVSAHAKISIDINRTYEVTEDERMKVIEVHTIKNNTDNLYIPAYENIQFNILGFRIEEPDIGEVLNDALNSAKITENGKEVKFESKIDENIAHLNFKYGTDFMSGDSRSFTFEYVHPSLVYKNGALLDIYIHAFAKDFPFETPNSISSYTTKLKIPKAINKGVNFINPEPTKVESTEKHTIYSFDQGSIIDNFVWLQLGTNQIYDFKITQEINPTEEKITGLKNRFELVLPKDFSGSEITQKVFFNNIKPEPLSVYEDEEGNLIAEYEFFSNEKKEIVVEGYAHVEDVGDVDYESIVGEKSDITHEFIEKYTHNAEYWEVNDVKIQNKAKELAGNSENVFEIAERVYSYIVDSIDYSEVKRFGLNERQGALKTLEGGAAVCMEYSDLFLTLMRANGIPARAIFGYGYDSRVSNEEQEAHQWVQVYMPGINNWVDVDVTWGESGDLLIGGDLNHFSTHVAYKDPNSPSMISRQAYGSSSLLKPPSFQIETIDKVEEDESLLLTGKQLLEKYPKVEEKQFNYALNQLKDRIIAGFSSLAKGLDTGNSSQIMALGVIAFASSVFFLGIKSAFKQR